MIPHHVEHKLERRIRKLFDWRYCPVADVPLEMSETMEHFRTPPKGLKYKAAPIGTRWGKDWSSAWFRGTAEIPKSCAGRRVYYRHGSLSEQLLFVDGKAFAGMNCNHREVLLTAKAKGGERLQLDLEAYASHPFTGVDPYNPAMAYHHIGGLGGPQKPPLITLEASELVVERETTAALAYDMNVLYKTALTLDDNSLRRTMLLDELNKAIDLIPIHWQSEEELEQACKAARKHIAPLLKLKNSPTTPHVGIVGHTHIDIAWLWPIRESVRKAGRTFATFLNLMEDYPKLNFVQSQPVLLDMIEKHYPELLPGIKAQVKKGRWEPNGGMWVEADCNLSSGESLVRQFLEGRKKTMELFGYQSDTLWLPDVFGYSAALPQILQLCEIDNFVTSKINWNDTTRFPYDCFIWEGIDGTEVFSHYITARNGGYNAQVLPEVSKDAWDYCQQKEVQDSVVLSVGYGDGGGGVTREMCEHAARMEDLEGCIKTSFVALSSFLKRLREQDVKRPRWVGELYFEYHRGTLTSQAKTKRYNRKMEFLLREVELYSAMAMVRGMKYPAGKLQELWRTVLTLQFHDILPGSSIREVYEQAEEQYAAVEAELLDLRAHALARLAQGVAFRPGQRNIVVANPLSWARSECVVLPGAGGESVYDARGNRLPSQPVGCDLAALVPLEGLSLSAVSIGPKEDGEAASTPFKHAARSLETPYYRIAFDKAGKITRLYDKDAKRDVVQKGRRLNDFYTAEDIPCNYDAWDIELYYRDKVQFEDRLISREVVEDGPLFTTIRTAYAIGRKSTLTQDMVFYAHSRRIDFKTEVDWQEDQTLLKVGFAVDIHADSYRNEIQYGHVVRPMHANTLADRAKFEVCAHKWVDVSEGGYGVALLNDCKYGHDSLDKMVSLTLLKSALAPDPTADKGRQVFTYALLPHEGGFSTETVVREGYSLNVPFSLAEVPKGTSTGEEALGLCSVSNPNVIVEAVKKAEEDKALIVRVYEAGKTRGKVTMTFSMPLEKVAECNLIEQKDKPVRVKGNAFSFDIKPFEIKTFKVYA